MEQEKDRTSNVERWREKKKIVEERNEGRKRQKGWVQNKKRIGKWGNDMNQEGEMTGEKKQDVGR